MKRIRQNKELLRAAARFALLLWMLKAVTF